VGCGNSLLYEEEHSIVAKLAQEDVETLYNLLNNNNNNNNNIHEEHGHYQSKPNQHMTHNKIIAMYCNTHTKHTTNTCTLRGQKA
jgi:hypothetical protein